MTLEELWEEVRRINAVGLAEDLLDPSEEYPVEPLLMTVAVQRALGNRCINLSWRQGNGHAAGKVAVSAEGVIGQGEINGSTPFIEGPAMHSPLRQPTIRQKL